MAKYVVVLKMHEFIKMSCLTLKCYDSITNIIYHLPEINGNI